MSSVSLKGLNAIVTGGSSGIGIEVARLFAKNGVNVILAARSVDKCENEASKLKKEHNVEAFAVKLDLSDKKSVDQSTKEMASKFKDQIDILVNCSGITGKKASCLEADPDDWEKVIAVNAINTMRLTRNLLPYITEGGEQRRKAVVMISSIAGLLKMGGSAPYCASKHAIEGFTGCLFEDIREKNVKVCAIRPGFVATSLTGVDDKNPNLDYDKMIQPEDVADLVYFVCSGPSTYSPTEITIRPQKTPYVKS